MFRMILIVTFVLVVGSGAVVAAQSGGQQAQTEVEEIGAPDGCGTPVASPPAVLGVSPEVDEVVVAAGTAIVSLHASPEASPMAGDACATPGAGTPAS